MASFSKVERSSVRPLYPSGSRGSYIAGSVDRSAMERPILGSLPSTSSTGSTVTQGDVTDFLQCLRFDPKSMATEYKFNRHGDFKQLASAALGVQDGLLKGKTPSLLPEGIKRLRAGLRESSVKGRERVKIFGEILSVANKCFPSIPSRKRSRPSGLSGDRTLMGRGVVNMGTPNHAPASVFDFEEHKVEERGKYIVPNKRTRTSMVDQRVDVCPITPPRSTASIERDKEVLRMTNSNGLQGEDRSFPIVRDGWEKPKMKKKRSAIKADTASSPSSGSTKPIDGYREPREGVHLRHILDARSRVTDSYGSRPGPANGVIGAGKADGIRSSILPTDHENTPLLYDNRERSNSTEKGRKKIKAVNKVGAREDFISCSPTSTKVHANIRGPRSGTGLGVVLPKLSPVVQRATASNDWGLPHETSKNPANHKRTPSISSSSPPVAQWADRRPQKISRTARRTNLVPSVPTSDEIPLDSPLQSKSKVDHMLLSALSDSEESGAVEFKVKQKRKKFDEFDNKTGKNVHKKSNLVPPTRKNKLEKGEGHADGVSRGRSRRGFGSARFTAPTRGEKLGCVRTVKQLRTAKLPFDKSERKFGQLSTRKILDRIAYTRQKHVADSTTSDFLGHALSSPFWRQMEPCFGTLSDMDISYLKRQDIIPLSSNFELDSDPLAPRTPSPVDIPLCQRLLSALISEDEHDEPTSSEWPFHNVELSVHDAFNGYGINSILRSRNEVTHKLSDSQVISMNERLLLEIQSIGLYPESLPDLVHTGEEDISEDIRNLEKRHHEKVFRMEHQLGKLLRSTTETRQLQEKEFEQLSLDKLTKMAYQKYMGCWGPNASGGKSASKLAKQDALALVNRTLEQCQKFETTGTICYDEPLFREMFVSGSSPFSDSQLAAEMDVDAGQFYENSLERASGTQQSPSSINHSIYIGAKGKRSERDKEWKGSNGFKVGHPALNDTKGERKTKTMLKQKTAQLSTSITGPQFDISDHHKPTAEIKLSNVKKPDEYDDEPLDFSHLPIPEMDILGDSFGEHGQDIGSWLNIDDEGFQDDDFMGLEIPMDDLTDLSMMV